MQQDSAASGPGSPGLYVAWSDNNYPGACPSSPGVGGWHVWRTPMPTVPSPGVYQPDFNGMGQTDTHIVWSGVLEPLTAGSPPYTLIRVISKAALSAWPGTLPYQDLVTQRDPSQFMHAADTFDAGSTIWLASVLVGTGNQLRIVRANQATGAEDQVLLTVPFFLPPAGAGNPPLGAPQLGGTFLDTIEGRMQSAVVRDGFLYCCHTVSANAGINAPNVVRWYQIALNGWPGTGTPSLVQSGDIALGLSAGGQPVHTFMPAVAVNQDGAMFIAYARSAADERPSLAWSARRGIHPPGTLPFAGTLKQSGVSYTTSNGVPGNANVHRWGDWSSAVVDVAAPTLRFIACGAFAAGGPALSAIGPGTCPNLFQANHWATWIHAVNINDPQWFFPYGSGSPGTGGVIPGITGVSNRPRIGTTTQVIVSNSAGVPTLGVGVISLAAAAGAPGPFGPVWVDLNQSVQLTFSLDPVSGSYGIAVPISPAFIGASLFLQAGVVDSGAAGGIALTAGVQIVIGS